MEVNFLNNRPIVQPQRINSHQTNPAVLKSIPYDSINFSGGQAVFVKTFSDLASEIEQQIIGRDFFNIKKIGKIVRSYCSNVNVLPLEKPQGKKMHSAYIEDFVINSSEEILSIPRLHIGKPKSNMPKHKAEFINELNLDIVEMLQNQDVNKAQVSLVKKYLKGKEVGQVNVLKARWPNDVFSNIKCAIEDTAKNSFAIKPTLSNASFKIREKYLEHRIRAAIGLDSETSYQNFINKKIYDENMRLACLVPEGLDRRYTLGIIELLAKNRAEAFALVNGRSGSSDNDFLVRFYSRLGKVAENMKQSQEKISTVPVCPILQ